MKKNLLISALCGLMAVVAVCGTASAQGFQQVCPSGQDLYFEILGDAAVVSYPAEEGWGHSDYTDTLQGRLEIPAEATFEGRPYPVKGVAARAFIGARNLTELSLPISLEWIDTAAFTNCSGLTSVTLPDSLKTLGFSAFGGCTALASIDMGNALKTIGGSAFSRCTALEAAVLGPGVETLGESAYMMCSGLRTIVLGQSLRSVGDMAFYHCSQVEHIRSYNPTSPDIGTDAFEGISEEAEVVIPCGSSSSYAIGWIRFENIQEDCDGIIPTESDVLKVSVTRGGIRIESEGTIGVFDMMGRRTAVLKGPGSIALERGLYILKAPDRTSRKIVVL